jgi:hypothetical protein
VSVDFIVTELKKVERQGGTSHDRTTKYSETGETFIMNIMFHLDNVVEIGNETREDVRRGSSRREDINEGEL